jgi:hypothetical protein
VSSSPEAEATLVELSALPFSASVVGAQAEKQKYPANTKTRKNATARIPFPRIDIIFFSLDKIAKSDRILKVPQAAYSSLSGCANRMSFCFLQAQPHDAVFPNEF